MCGIAGWVTTSRDPTRDTAVSQIAAALRHRGPDDRGFLSFDGTRIRRGDSPKSIDKGALAILIHTRLSILDLTREGWQPMSSADGRYHLVFNGEIYNYIELRSELQRIGRTFRSRSDTEVLLAAYAQWGKDCLSRLVGMFAFAVLDTKAQRLFLARDFFGIKPLYFTTLRNGVAFASEIKALLELPGVSREVDPHRAYMYLRYGIADSMSGSMLSSVAQVPPAHYLELDLATGRASLPRRYWSIDLTKRLDVSFEEAQATTREIFFDSVKLHLRSDVSVGAALSGGIDSSAIVGVMRRLLGEELDLQTFTFLAGEPAIDEERWADRAAAASDALQTKIRPSAQEFVADIPELIRIQDEPFGSTSIYAQYRVFRAAHEQGVKVMLDGQGADEIFGGYEPYLYARVASLVREGETARAIHTLRGVLSRTGTGLGRSLPQVGAFLLSPSVSRYARASLRRHEVPSWFASSWLKEREVRGETPQNIRGKDMLRQYLYRTLTETTLPALLRYEDRNSMAFSIESRVPFLVPRLAEFVFALPESYLVSDEGVSKHLLRASVRRFVPHEILQRRDKIGFATPERMWLSAVAPWVSATLASANPSDVPILNLQEARKRWEFLLNREEFDKSVWRWVNLIEWSRQIGATYP